MAPAPKVQILKSMPEPIKPRSKALLRPDFMSCSFYIEPIIKKPIVIEKVVVKNVEKIVEVPKEIIKTKTVEVEKIVEVVKPMPRSKSKT